MIIFATIVTLIIDFIGMKFCYYTLPVVRFSFALFYRQFIDLITIIINLKYLFTIPSILFSSNTI